MKDDRNPHKALSLLNYSPGSLLAHLPTHLHNLTDAKFAAHDFLFWKTLFQMRVTLNMQFT